jgi:SSS family solute:Na+ symporter
MNMAPVDWAIVIAMLGVMVTGVVLTKSYMRSVADFLAAGRTAGRYVVSVALGIAGLGAITVVGLLEMNYIAGFAMTWWGFTMSVVILILTVSGWVIYRFRQTRSLTLPEFFERRYSKNFRVFAGLIAFLSGLINFGIFPAVGARFFIYFCGLPHSLAILGLTVPTFPLVMIVLLGIALFFVFQGGQIAVLITDFAQGLFVNVAFVVIVLFLYLKIDWTQIIEALSAAPEQKSLINPFKTGHVEDFNFWYFLIGVVGVIYGAMSWQGTQAYNTSAKSAHEAKMAGVLGNWKGFPQGLFILFVPIIIYTVMHHPDFAGIAAAVESTIAGAGSEALVSQLRGPVVLTHLLPVGLMGAFAAVMLAAFVSTHDTYLHSWGSILIQDVVMPFRKRRFSQKEHLRLLRLSIFGVAVFIFFFSLLFQQSEHIFLFFAITGAIFAGGSGAVIIGGLYWKRGTAPAAWTALIAGSTIAVGGILIHQMPAALFDAAPADLTGLAHGLWRLGRFLYNVNGQQYWALAMGVSSILYVAVSLLGPRRTVDFDKLFHRGRYDTAHETTVVTPAPARGWRMLGMGREFTRADRAIYIATYIHIGVWFAIFVVGTIYNLTHDVEDAIWAAFWRRYFYIQVAYTIFVIVWFTIGGFRDIGVMLRKLRVMRRDEADDGMVAEEEGGRE